MFLATLPQMMYPAEGANLHSHSGASRKVSTGPVPSVRRLPDGCSLIPTKLILTIQHVGPVIVSKSLIPDPSQLYIRGLKNGAVTQSCGVEYVILSPYKVVSVINPGHATNPVLVI